MYFQVYYRCTAPHCPMAESVLARIAVRPYRSVPYFVPYCTVRSTAREGGLGTLREELCRAGCGTVASRLSTDWSSPGIVRTRNTPRSPHLPLLPHVSEREKAVSRRGRIEGDRAAQQLHRLIDVTRRDELARAENHLFRVDLLSGGCVLFLSFATSGFLGGFEGSRRRLVSMFFVGSGGRRFRRGFL